MTYAPIRRGAEGAPPGPPEGGRTRTFEALQVRDYRRLFTSGVLGFLAVQSQMIAQGWLARELTGSNAGLGGVSMAFGVVMLLATPWGGVAADRLSKRNLLVVSHGVLVLSGLWIGLAVAFDVAAYWMLLASSAMQGLAFSFLGPARMAFTGELVGLPMLPNAIVLGQMSMNASRVLGPSLAGVLIGVAWVGVAGVYLITATLSLGALVAATLLPPGRPAMGGPKRSPGADLLDGVRYLRGNRPVLLLILTSLAVVMVAFPYISFLPTLADGIFDVGPGGYGTMSAVGAIGALTVTLAVAGRAGGPGVWRLQSIAGVAFGLLVAVLGLAPNYATALIVVLVLGAAAAGFQALNNSLVLALSDISYHGRMQSLMMLSFSAFGMAALPLGIIADAIGLRSTLVGMGLVALAAMAAHLVVRPAMTVDVRGDGRRP